LHAHVEQAERFELARAREPADVDWIQRPVAHERRDRLLGLVVVACDIDVERLARDLTLDERPGERRVEGLHERRVGCELGELLGGRPIRWYEQVVEALVDRVGDDVARDPVARGLAPP
jgi:hypothetical protein